MRRIPDVPRQLDELGFPSKVNLDAWIHGFFHLGTFKIFELNEWMKHAEKMQHPAGTTNAMIGKARRGGVLRRSFQDILGHQSSLP